MKTKTHRATFAAVIAGVIYAFLCLLSGFDFDHRGAGVAAAFAYGLVISGAAFALTIMPSSGDPEVLLDPDYP